MIGSDLERFFRIPVILKRYDETDKQFIERVTSKLVEAERVRELGSTLLIAVAAVIAAGAAYAAAIRFFQ